MRLRRRESRLDAYIGLLPGLGKRREPRQQHLVGEERRHVEPDDRASVANLQLFGDRLELRENVVDVLEIMSARIGQCQRAYPARAALEQYDAELRLERFDLVADGRRRDEQFLGS